MEGQPTPRHERDYRSERATEWCHCVSVVLGLRGVEVTRQVPMTQEQYDALNENIIPSLMRADMTEMATQMMGLALAFKWAGEPVQELPENVVSLDTHIGSRGA